ncbi:hypothetical protein D0Z07_2054 [Hyphodiscus hymeniophilus]|uniref:Uncharacterized protein n=1 Tax=Hyphodiscus hymeniophilus TaxID=353542 RepID=A0A9P6VN75_9HELO|nr:hypothetical protein D0Z07_2054 [Hyphodiscus hymeniophilus]
MDAHALLTSQGWRGKGHSLHPTSDTTGLSRPLLVSQKQNNLGVGKKQHKTSDMWWMNAFDKSLQGLDTSEQGKVIQTITSGGLDMVVKGGGKWVGSSGGLYASFVRGEGLGGTLTPDTTEGSINEESIGKKRRREEGAESKEERRERKAAKRAIKPASEGTPELGAGLMLKEKKKSRRSAEESPKTQVSAVETKEARRARRAAGKASKTKESSGKKMDVAETTHTLMTKDGTKSLSSTERAKESQKAAVEQGSDRVEVDEVKEKPETKEEKRARRAAQKASKILESTADEGDKMEVDGTTENVESTEQRRARKRQSKLLKEAAQKASEDTVPAKT